MLMSVASIFHDHNEKIANVIDVLTHHTYTHGSQQSTINDAHNT